MRKYRDVIYEYSPEGKILLLKINLTVCFEYVQKRINALSLDDIYYLLFDMLMPNPSHLINLNSFTKQFHPSSHPLTFSTLDDRTKINVFL